jgi:hypothetical protein
MAQEISSRIAFRASHSAAENQEKKRGLFFLEKQGTLPGSIMNNETTASLHQHSQPQSNENKSRN